MFPAQQVHGSDQAHQSEIVVAMEMGNKNMIDLLQADLLPSQLYLGSFSTIEKEQLPVYRHQLRTRITMCEGYGSPAAKYAYSKSHTAR